MAVVTRLVVVVVAMAIVTRLVVVVAMAVVPKSLVPIGVLRQKYLPANR